MKICKKCNIEKPLNSFYDNVSGKQGKHAYCVTCANKMNRIYSSKIIFIGAYRTYSRADNRHLANKFKITAQQHNALLVAQNNTCTICGSVFEYHKKGAKYRPCVDHCHSSGKVRGIICSECNTGLGKFKDSIEILNKAISYLQT